MKFEYYRFLLTPIDEPELPLHGKLSREEVITKIFSKGKSYEFKSGKASYGFVLKSISDAHKMGIGRVGKQKSERLFGSPSEGFAEKQEENWPGSDVLINFDDEKSTGKTRESGQVMAIQVNRSAITNPTNCLRALADKINQEIILYGFYITINPILKPKKKFWSVVNENKGNIKKVVLIYTPPNIFNLQNKLSDDLKEANKKYNITSTQIILENEMGHLDLPDDDPLLEQSAEYIDEGQGSYQIHLSKGKKNVLKSEAGVVSESFEGFELTMHGQDAEQLKDVLEQVLERKHND